MCKRFKTGLKRWQPVLDVRGLCGELWDLKEDFLIKMEIQGKRISAMERFLRGSGAGDCGSRRCTWTVIPLSAVPLKDALNTTWEAVCEV